MTLDGRQTLILAILTLFLGSFLTRRIGFLRHYNIPEPVTGGILVSVLVAIVHTAADFDIDFTLASRDVLLVVFFTTVGLNAKLGTLVAGGKPLLILTVCAAGFLVFQNLTGVGVAALFGAEPLTGLMGGSISLSGGHGTSIAWAPVFRDEYGIEGAAVIGIAVATVGLVLGGVIGGPISQFLIKRNDLTPPAAVPDEEQEFMVGLPREEAEAESHRINADNVLSCFLIISVAIKVPDFVGALLVGIVLTNAVPAIAPTMRWPSGSKSLALIADVSLSLFLAMSLMSLQLWSIFALAGPLVVLLGAQLLAITAWVVFVVFPLMGKTYDAAVMAGGYAGLGLGATPTAVANMTAVTKKFGPSALAFLIVPLVGAFFIDIANAVIIKTFIKVLS
jgi:ESS family glutamate:Na+ symporter